MRLIATSGSQEAPQLRRAASFPPHSFDLGASVLDQQITSPPSSGSFPAGPAQCDRHSKTASTCSSWDGHTVQDAELTLVGRLLHQLLASGLSELTSVIVGMVLPGILLQDQPTAKKAVVKQGGLGSKQSSVVLTQSRLL